MAVPDFQSFLLPLLKLTASKPQVKTTEAYAAMAAEFKLTAADLAEPMPSGGSTSRFRNRVAWAKQYLMYARLIEAVSRGVSRITKEGQRWAKRKEPLKIRDFEVIPGFSARVHGTSEAEAPPTTTTAAPQSIATPDERMDEADREVRQSVIASLLDRIRQKPPKFLEQLVIGLMSKLNYGDGSPESMLHSGKTGDGGVDGIIKMDVLGLEHICLQAKRYDAAATVSREQVAAFAGSIAGSKGVLVTTSTFSKQAHEFVRASHKNIVLVDGQKLGELMLRAGLGVSVKKTYRVFALDEDFFSDEE